MLTIIAVCAAVTWNINRNSDSVVDVDSNYGLTLSEAVPMPRTDVSNMLCSFLLDKLSYPA